MTCMGSDGSAGAYGLNMSLLEDLARYALILTPSRTVVSDTEIVSPEILATMQTSGSKEAYAKGDFTEHPLYFPKSPVPRPPVGRAAEGAGRKCR